MTCTSVRWTVEECCCRHTHVWCQYYNISTASCVWGDNHMQNCAVIHYRCQQIDACELWINTQNSRKHSDFDVCVDTCTSVLKGRKCYSEGSISTVQLAIKEELKFVFEDGLSQTLMDTQVCQATYNCKCSQMHNAELILYTWNDKGCDVVPVPKVRLFKQYFSIGWLWARLSFSHLRSAVMCIRGSRSIVGHARHDSMPDVAIVESWLQLD